MNKETQNIEFKESWRDEYLKWICGFANAQGGTQDINLPTGPVDARYVRILCQQRNTGYGASLWEVEVYGVKAPTSVQQPSVETITTKYILRNGQIYILRNHEIYDLRGQKVEEN